MTTNPYCRVDPALPDVLDAEVVCCHCRQTLETILEGGPALPDRHFVRPVKIAHQSGPAHIRTSYSANRHPLVCPNDYGQLSALILRAQWRAAGLNPGGAA